MSLAAASVDQVKAIGAFTNFLVNPQKYTTSALERKQVSSAKNYVSQIRKELDAKNSILAACSEGAQLLAQTNDWLESTEKSIQQIELSEKVDKVIASLTKSKQYLATAISNSNLSSMERYYNEIVKTLDESKEIETIESGRSFLSELQPALAQGQQAIAHAKLLKEAEGMISKAKSDLNYVKTFVGQKQTAKAEQCMDKATAACSDLFSDSRFRPLFDSEKSLQTFLSEFRERQEAVGRDPVQLVPLSEAPTPATDTAPSSAPVAESKVETKVAAAASATVAATAATPATPAAFTPVDPSGLPAADTFMLRKIDNMKNGVLSQQRNMPRAVERLNAKDAMSYLENARKSLAKDEAELLSTAEGALAFNDLKAVIAQLESDANKTVAAATLKEVNQKVQLEFVFATRVPACTPLTCFFHSARLPEALPGRIH